MTKFLIALLLALLLTCVALVAEAQEHPQSPNLRPISWYLYQGYLLDSETLETRGSYTLTRIEGDRQSRDGFLLITIGTRDGAWIVVVIPGSGERPKWQVAPATGLGSLSRWSPKDGVMEVGDVRWALAMRGVLEEVQSGQMP